MSCRLMKTARKNKNESYKGACYVSLSPAALKQYLRIIWLLGNTEIIWWQFEELPESWLIVGCFTTMGLIEKDFSHSSLPFIFFLQHISSLSLLQFTTVFTVFDWLAQSEQRRVEQAMWRVSFEANKPRKQQYIQSDISTAGSEDWDNHSPFNCPRLNLPDYSLPWVRLPSLCDDKV